jgi:hypothetical protein
VITSPVQFTVQLQSSTYSGTPTLAVQVTLGDNPSQQFIYTLSNPVLPGDIALATFLWAPCGAQSCPAGNSSQAVNVSVAVLDQGNQLIQQSRQFLYASLHNPPGPLVASTSLGFPVALCGPPCSPPPGLIVEPAASAFLNQGADYEVTVQLQPLTFKGTASVQYRLSVGGSIYGSGLLPIVLTPGRPASAAFSACLGCGQGLNLHGQTGTLQVTVFNGTTPVAEDGIGFFVQ